MEKLMLSISSRLDRLVNIKYPKQGLLDFYLSIKDNGINAANLIIAYYFSVNDEYDILKITEEVYSCNDLINNYIENIRDYIKPTGFNSYDFDLSLFDSTPFCEKRYQKVLIEVFTSIINSNIYIDGINSIDNEKVTLKVKAKLDSSFVVNEINRKYFAMIKEYNKFYIGIQKEGDALIGLTNWLSREVNNDKITYCPNDIISKIHDDEVIYNIHRVVVCFNNDYFVRIYNKHKELVRNNVSYLRHLLKDLVNVSNIPEDCIKIISEYGNLDEIINILYWLNSVKLNIINFRNKDGMSVLVSTNVKTLYSIYVLIQNGIISEKFVLKNPSILYDMSVINNKNIGIYSEVIKKYNLLKQHNFNLSNIDEILLLDINCITFAIIQFNSYGLNKNKEIHKDMFTNKNFFNYIDLFIELGIYDYIKNNFDIIDDDCYNIIKRIYISKMMRLSIFDSSGNLLQRVITGNDFYVSNDNLDNYIISISDQMIDSNILYSLGNICEVSNVFNDEINDFDKHFTLDSATYKFGNILISRNKVLRNYNHLRNTYPDYDKLSLLESSIIYNSILDISDVYTIKDLFDDFCSIKQKKI